MGLSLTIKEDCLKMRLNAWSKKPKNTRLKMTRTRTELKRRTDLRITATPSKVALALMKSRTRFQLMTRKLWKTKLRQPFLGWMQTRQLRKKNSKRNKKSWKVSHCQSYKKWEAEQEECQEVCQEECLTWVACLIWEVWEVQVHHQQKIQQADQQLKKLIKTTGEMFSKCYVVLILIY